MRIANERRTRRYNTCSDALIRRNKTMIMCLSSVLLLLFLQLLSLSTMIGVEASSSSTLPTTRTALCNDTTAFSPRSSIRNRHQVTRLAKHQRRKSYREEEEEAEVEEQNQYQQAANGLSSSSSSQRQPNLVSSLSRPRGGAVGPTTNVSVFLPMTVSTLLETITMLALLICSIKAVDIIPPKWQRLPMTIIYGLPLTTYVALFIIIFASSVLGSIVDGTVTTVATAQVLRPNAIPGDPKWYSRLKKPKWNPPGWLFPIMWLLISKPTQFIAVTKLLNAVAASASGTPSLGVDSNGSINTSSDDAFNQALDNVVQDVMAGKTTTSQPPEIPILALAVYCFHLALGDTWNKIFFGLQSPGRGAFVITLFYGMLLLSTYLFAQIDKTAGMFLLPTCGWVTVATALNWYIYLNNK